MSSPERHALPSKPPARPSSASTFNAELSPGAVKSPEANGKTAGGAHLGTPREVVGTLNNSPFREWATSNLSGFSNDIAWPANASRSILSPSYPHMRGKEESENSPIAVASRGEGDIGQVEHNSPVLALEKEQKDCAQTKSEVDIEDDAGQEARRPPFRLSLSEEVTFELLKDDNKVLTTGFRIPPTMSTRSKKPAPPPTPVLPPSNQVTPQQQAQQQSAVDLGDKRRICFCKKSKCLKLYCECFAAGALCSACRCSDCANDGLHEDERMQAVKSVKQRNVNAFAPKIVDDQAAIIEKGKHARGCRCKKSHCLKKYCECFQAGVECTDKCRCDQCQNRSDFDGTPRDRPDDAVRTRAESASSDHSDDEEDHSGDNGPDSPPRNKKPRMLDFNLLNTPSATQASIQESPFDVSARPGGLAMSFGSPSMGITHASSSAST